MSAIMERIQRHFESLGTRTIEVPEWGEDGKPLQIRALPLTISDKAFILQQAGHDEFKQLVWTLIRCARTPAGDPVWHRGDRAALEREADERIIRRIAEQILLGPTEADLGN